MMKTNLYFKYLLLCAMITLQLSCKDFVTIEAPKNQILNTAVFTNDESATSGIRGIYSAMITSSNFAGGNAQSITNLTGLYADELDNYSSIADRAEFYTNSVLPTNAIVNTNIWAEGYKLIYYTNAMLEGLEGSSNISLAVQKQLEGEAKFIRAFYYFYLVNLFGDIPMPLSTDYTVNSVIGLQSKTTIYTQIVKDLEDAKELLAVDYSYAKLERVRVNKYAAIALLSRVYLYLGQWGKAETYATTVIDKTDLYGLETDLKSVFLKNSKEAIFQLMGTVTSLNTFEGTLFILTSRPTGSALRSDLKQSFEFGDMRQKSWIDSVTSAGIKYYYPFKYKLRVGTAPLAEYYMVLRLAEQYLIRAEAKINQNKMEEGVNDLNIIRNRSRSTTPVPNPLPALPASLSKAEALIAVEKERRAELFAEWGHRWFDLKRTGRANSVLSNVKGNNWQQSDLYIPIPQLEIEKNPNLNNISIPN